MIENYEVIGRLVLALFLGALLGVERIHAGKTAGIRTFGLVALGSALFIIISEQVIARYGYQIDPLRVAANLVTGIGFLGAGMIVFQQNHVSNLTTAAGMWLSAAIGAAVGFGLYIESITVTLLVIVTFTLMWNMETYLKRRFCLDKNNDDVEHVSKK
jgi:putative Mg2+ transporter-C (MgtC) family protein